MAANAWIITAYPNEADNAGDANIGYVMGANNEWLNVDAQDGNPELVNGAAIFLDLVFNTAQVRGIQGGFQQRYTDRDVRMERVTVVVNYPSI